MRFLPVAALLLAVAGCGPKEEVRRYKASKDPTWRMIGAIVPAKDATWFFKVAAPTDRISAAQEQIVTFLRGLRAEEGEVKWTTPAGWTEEKGGPARQASFKFGDRDPKLELTVVRLPGDGGGLAANVDRWRGQAGLEPLGEQGLGRSATPMKFVGTDAWLVEAVGKDRAILGVIALSPEYSMFLKMDGTASAVSAQRATFTQVAQSFKMKGRDE